MSDHIPLELQIEIMKRLPIKSLIQFRYVSKAWKSVIESADFIADYTVRSHAQQQHQLIRYKNSSYEEIYISILDDDDDDSFPQNKVSLTVPPSIDLLCDSFFVGSSHGLVCLFGYYRNLGDFERFSGTKVAVVWNPLIRKSVAIDVPNVNMPEGTYFGFGVCPATIDPKIVKIRKMKSVSCSRWQVEVFSLSSGVWKVLSNNNLSDNLVSFDSPVTVDGFIYWLGYDNFTSDSDTGIHSVISFDLSCEEFGEIDLPDELAFHDHMELFLLKRDDSLAVFQGWLFLDTYEVWMMMMVENGDSKSFTKRFTFKVPDMPGWPWPMEYRRNGEVMMRIIDENEDSDALVVYQPLSEHINDLGIKGQCYSLDMSLYTESLILLDQEDMFVDYEDDEEEMSD